MPLGECLGETEAEDSSSTFFSCFKERKDDFLVGFLDKEGLLLLEVDTEYGEFGWDNLAAMETSKAI